MFIFLSSSQPIQNLPAPPAQCYLHCMKTSVHIFIIILFIKQNKTKKKGGNKILKKYNIQLNNKLVSISTQRYYHGEAFENMNKTKMIVALQLQPTHPCFSPFLSLPFRNLLSLFLHNFLWFRLSLEILQETCQKKTKIKIIEKIKL